MLYQYPIVSICWKYKELKQGGEASLCTKGAVMVTVIEELDETLNFDRGIITKGMCGKEV